MSKFMESGSEIEHAAFLAMWLSKFVFPAPAFDTIRKLVFPIAIHLSRGVKIALALSVLASLYRDLSMIKQGISCLETSECKDDVSAITVWFPFRLILIWVWERFPNLRQNPNSIENGDPRLARWHEVKKLNIEDPGLAIDLEEENLLWRRYAADAKKFHHCRLFSSCGIVDSSQLLFTIQHDLPACRPFNPICQVSPTK